MIDADPDANISDLINKQISFRDTIAGVITELGRKLERKEIPPYQEDRFFDEEVYWLTNRLEDISLIKLAEQRIGEILGDIL